MQKTHDSMRAQISDVKKPALGGFCGSGRRGSGHEDGDERQQEDQQAADHRDDDRDVLDHGFCRIDGGLFVVSRHGVSPNSNMGCIVAKTDPGLI